MDEDLKQALATLREGGVIIYPTDTVWGIGCDATNAEAVARVMEIKGRSDAKAMLVLVGNDGMLQRYVPEIPDAAWQLIDVADTPLTIVYDRVEGIAPALRAEDGSTGVRVTSETFSRNLCTRLGHPIVSTSANFSGAPTPKCFAEIDPAFLEKADYVVNYRRDDRRRPSPSGIIKVSRGDVIKVIR
ncbi:MAG: threonylcarbamoyl-AMP synthase [Muribaculaceae bacterium]|nr:threonylcarbamoyl-AMP synthase [Muribaculaceae bacterium]